MYSDQPHTPHVNSISGCMWFSYEQRTRWCTHQKRARYTRSRRCRSTLSWLIKGRAFPEECQEGPRKRLLIQTTGNQKTFDIPNRRDRLVVRRAVLCELGVVCTASVYLMDCVDLRVVYNLWQQRQEISACLSDPSSLSEKSLLSPFEGDRLNRHSAACD